MPKPKLHQWHQSGATTGQVPVWGGTEWAPGDAAGGAALPVFDVVAYGAAVDGSTDDTTAWQAVIDAAAAAGGGRIISSKAGVSIIGGALQDTSGANSQLTLPKIDYADSEAITLVIEGAFQPPTVESVIGTTVAPDNHLVLKSTLTSGSGGALLGGVGPTGTFQSFTNVNLVLRNLSFRMPANPTHTALNLIKVACVDLDGVLVDAGSFSIDSIGSQTTSTSYGIKLPDLGNGAHVRLGQVDVVGFYNGILYNEHTLGQYVAAWGCMVAHTFAAGYHASKFLRMAYYHCQTGVKFTGDHYVDIDQLNVEHAASGTWAPVYDIDDASNHGHGKVKWHVVKADVGVDPTFAINGGSHLTTSAVGDESGGGGGSYSLTVEDEGSSVDASTTSLNFVGDDVTATSDGSGHVSVSISGGGGYREIVMESGAPAPTPILNSAGDDYIYGEPIA